VLNRLGHRTGTGNSWTRGRATGFRNHHGVPVFQPSPDGSQLLTLGQAARQLGVNKPFVQRLIALRLLSPTQPVLYAPWSIRSEDLQSERVQQAVAAAKSRGRAFPRNGEPGPADTRKLNDIERRGTVSLHSGDGKARTELAVGTSVNRSSARGGRRR
jgi:hypothetical protein